MTADKKIDPHGQEMLVDATKIPVTSSNLAACSYNPASSELHIEFKNGRVWTYAGVSSEMFGDFLNAESQGKFFSENIKGKFESVDVTDTMNGAPAETEEQRKRREMVTVQKVHHDLTVMTRHMGVCLEGLKREHIDLYIEKLPQYATMDPHSEFIHTVAKMTMHYMDVMEEQNQKLIQMLKQQQQKSAAANQAAQEKPEQPEGDYESQEDKGDASDV